MDLSVRRITQDDYDTILTDWWHRWKWVPPPSDFIPMDTGYMAMDGDIPVCAGFVYMTNSKVAWIEFIISNPDYRGVEKRTDVITYLILFLTELASKQGYKYCYTLLKSKSLMDMYKSVGYVQGDKDATEMIKVL